MPPLARPHLAIALLAAALAAAPAAATAQSRLILDRVIAEPSYFEGRARVRAFVSPLTIEGRLLDLEPGELGVRAGSSDLRAPYFVSPFSSFDIDLAIAIVVETAYDYEQDLPAIQRALTELVRALPRSSRIAVIGYGGQVEGGHRLESPSDAAGRIDALLPDLAPEEPVLIEAGERALRTLRRADADEGLAPPRRVMIVVSDGQDFDPRPERFRELGQRAARHDVRIHSLAYSPIDNRRPLLGLGELSKRSGGTFRWVRDPRGVSSHADNLRAEILDQPVLTLFPPADDVTGARLTITRGEERSEAIRVRELSCGDHACEGDAYCAAGRCVERPRAERAGVVGWLIRIALAIAVAFAALLIVGFALTRRDEARRARAAAAVSAASHGHQPMAGQPPGGAVAGQPPGGAPVAPNVVGQPPGGARPTGPHAAAPVATLFVVAGPRQGQRLPLRHGFTVGKGKRCDLALPGDPHIADRHAQFLADAAGGYTVVDLGSASGTFVNGVRTAQARLPHGASIKVGGVELRFLAS